MSDTNIANFVFIKMSKLVKIYYRIIPLLAYESSFCNF